MTDICRIVYDRFKDDINNLMDNLIFYKSLGAGYEATFGICQIDKNKYTRTEIEEDLMGSVELPTNCPDSSKLVGAFHTHPSSKFFSTGDMLITIKNNLDFTCIGYYDEEGKPFLKCADLSKSDKKKLLKEVSDLHAEYLLGKWERTLTSEKSLNIIKSLEEKVKETGGEYCEIPIKVISE